MIKTLRITSIIAVVLAAVFFVFPAAFGVRGDKQIEQFLNSAGVIEKFKETKGDKMGEDKREISPLVKQAEAFALYLNPPPKPKSEPSASVGKSELRPVGPVSAKFKLVGTSRHVLQPELSLALVDEPGKGLYWVRQSSKVGHLIIEQIRDGVVVVRDGQNTFELVMDKPEKRSLLKSNTSPGGRITSGLPPEAVAAVQVGTEEKQMSEAEMEKALAEVNAMQAEPNAVQADVGADRTDSGPQTLAGTEPNAAQKEIAATGQKSASDPEAMRISAREARRLDHLGRRLKNVQPVPPGRGGSASGETSPVGGQEPNQ